MQATNLKLNRYAELKVVSKCKLWVVKVYDLTNHFPKSELYGLTSQIRRAAVSVLLNMVEGRRKSSDKDFLKFLDIADASLAETQIALELSLLLKYVSNPDYEQIEKERTEIAYMLSSLIRAVKKRLYPSIPPKPAPHKLRSLYLFISLTLYTCLSPQSISAKVIITEVSPAPSTGNSEWIEIYNDSTAPVDLTHWVLQDQLTTPSVLYTFTPLSLEDDSFLLMPESYYVVTLTSSKLNNSADGITLISPKGGSLSEGDQEYEIIDQMSYTFSQTNKTWSWDDQNHSWVLCDPSPGEILLAKCLVTTEPSPSTTPAPTPSPTPQLNYQLSLSEIYPAPNSGETEWIEIYNNSGTIIKFDTLKIVDQSNNKKTLDQVIFNPASYTILEWTGSLLNNDGDSVSLVYEDQVLLTASFEAGQKGSSFIQVDGDWILTSLPTPGNTNQFLSTEEEQSETEASTTAAVEETPVEELHSSPLPSASGPPIQHLPDQYLNQLILTTQQPISSPSTEINLGESPLSLSSSDPATTSFVIFVQLMTGGLSVGSMSGFQLLKHLQAFEKTQIHL